MNTNRRFVRVAAAVATLLVVGYAALVGFQIWALRDFANAYPQPGRLVEVDGSSFHLNCSGSGAPTVILEAGAGSWSLDWRPIQAELSKSAQVCSYDRAGIGWSDKRSEPRDINRLVSELDALVRHAQLKPPYVMVGASFGGMIVQLFEQRYPELVSALVLVDGRAKDYFERYEEIVPQAKSRLIDEMNTILTLHDFGLLAAIVSLTPPDGIPADLEEIYLHPGRITKHAVGTARERVDGANNESLAQAINGIGNKPLLVISHGKTGMFEGRPGVSKAQAEALEALFSSLQDELAALSTLSRHVVAEQSGHAIQLDQPDIVAMEISRLIESYLRE